MHLSGKERKINLGIVVMLHRLLFDIPRKVKHVKSKRMERVGFEQLSFHICFFG